MRSSRLPLVGRRLDALLESTDRAARRDADPVSFVHRYESAADREVAGLVASSLAFGNVAAIRAKVAIVLGALGGSPSATIDRSTRADLRRRLRGFRHRVWRGEDVAAMLASAGAMRREHGSLGARFAVLLEREGELLGALAIFADEVRGSRPSRGLRHLVPDPRAGSACKRLLLYLRWMCRLADGVDVGIWSVPPSRLVIPVDVHVHRIARNLGLTERSDASMRTAIEITDRLRAFDRDDPVRYDFAICHLGVSRQCPSRRDERKCADCVLKEACRHWARG
jgi:uncharacterized protein (TIGR02757 family)